MNKLQKPVKDGILWFIATLICISIDYRFFAALFATLTILNFLIATIKPPIKFNAGQDDLLVTHIEKKQIFLERKNLEVNFPPFVRVAEQVWKFKAFHSENIAIYTPANEGEKK